MLTKEGREVFTEIWFQKYRILSQLGEGGTAEVFLGEHIRLGYLRAIKRIKKEQPAYEQLMQEADILKGLTHPCIPVIYDVEEDAQYSYIIMEYVKGPSLKALCLKQGHIKETEIVIICLQICKVFQLLHSAEQSILYLDLKPDNIIVQESKIKIIDFGAAKMAGETRQRISMGTIGFAAPEQYTLKGVDRQSDIYGLGNLLLFMATGASGTAGMKLLEKEKEYTNSFKQIVFQCLKYNKSERFESIEQMEERLLALYPTRTERKTDKSGASIAVAFAGVQPRCGVTHICMLFTEFLCLRGKKAVYVEAGQHRDIQLFFGEKNQTTFPILCGEPELLKEKYKEYSIFICDYGVYTEAGKSMWKMDTVCFVTCVKPWERQFWKNAENTILQMKFHEEVGKEKQFYFLINLTGAREFFSLAKECKVSCLRMPYREQALKEDKELQSLLDRVLKGNIYEEKKRTFKNSLFGWCRTWCRSDTYGYIIGRIFKRTKRGANAVFRSK